MLFIGLKRTKISCVDYNASAYLHNCIGPLKVTPKRHTVYLQCTFRGGVSWILILSVRAKLTVLPFFKS